MALPPPQLCRSLHGLHTDTGVVVVIYYGPNIWPSGELIFVKRSTFRWFGSGKDGVDVGEEHAVTRATCEEESRGVT
eukprot:scaffold43259_cov66-Attheya_sp.AAC.7